MADTRENLIELLESAESAFYWDSSDKGFVEKIADHLIANGVTINKGTECTPVAYNLSPTEPLPNCQQWIPVTEDLPKLIPCGAGTAYSEAVNVLTSGRKVLTAIWDGTDFIADAEFWEAEGEEITHWTPVPLPLPEPPKGE